MEQVEEAAFGALGCRVRAAPEEKLARNGGHKTTKHY